MSSPKVDASYLQGIKQAQGHISKLLEDKQAVPLFIRLALHDASAYDSAKNTYGANASIRTQKELSHKGNEGLNKAVEWLAQVKSQVPVITFADLYQLAGIMAVQHAGGPPVRFAPGRKDAWTFPPQSAYLSPNTGSNPLKEFLQWVQRTGLPLRSCVALLGVHSIARWWTESNGSYSLPHETLASPKFSNQYFGCRDLVAGNFPQDAWLLKDSSIKPALQEFAENESAFREAYADAHEQLSLLGTQLTAAAFKEDLEEAGASALDYGLSESVQYVIAAGACVVACGLVTYGIWRRRRRAARLR